MHPNRGEGRISVVIPVIDEQKTINQAIERVCRPEFSDKPEVIVADGCPDGSTLVCIDNPDVVKVISPPGRGRQMNKGAEKASGEILLFLHCDTALPDNALRLVHRVMEKDTVKAGAFDLSIDGNGFGYRLVEKVATLRSRISRIPYGDQAIFIERRYFFEIGKFPEIPIMEDVALMRKVRRRGDRIEIVNRPVSTAARRWEKEGILLCTLRNWMIITLYLCGVSPETLSRFYQNMSN